MTEEEKYFKQFAGDINEIPRWKDPRIEEILTAAGLELVYQWDGTSRCVFASQHKDRESIQSNLEALRGKYHIHTIEINKLKWVRDLEWFGSFYVNLDPPHFWDEI